MLDPIEGINASVSLNMFVQSRFFTPSLSHSLAYQAKNIGFWWLESAALSIFDWSEWTMRFWPALAGIGMAIISGVIARHLQSDRAGNYAMVIAGSSLLTFIVSQLAAPYSLYTFFVSLAAVGILLGWSDRRAYLLLHFAAVSAFIVYGPSGFFLPWMTLLLYSFWEREEDLFWEALLYVPGLIATTFLGGGYLLLIYAGNPDLLGRMFYSLPAQAFNGLGSGLRLLLIAFCPWAGLLPSAMRSAAPTRNDAQLPYRRPEVFLFFWICIFLFFSILSQDVLLLSSIVPAGSALIGINLARTVENRDIKALQLAVAAEILFFLFLLVIGLPWFYWSYSTSARGTWISAVPWGLFGLLFLFCGWVYIKTRQPKKMMIHCSLWALLSLMPMAGFFNLLAENLSLGGTGLYLQNNSNEEDILVQYRLNYPSLFFYTNQDYRIVGGGVGPEIYSESDLARSWIGPKRVFMILSREQISPPLANEADVFDVYKSDHRIMVLSNRQPEVPEPPAKAPPLLHLASPLSSQ